MCTGRDLERVLRRRPEPGVDRSDPHIMQALVGARSRAPNRRAWVVARARILGSFDLVEVKDPQRLRWAK